MRRTDLPGHRIIEKSYNEIHPQNSRFDKFWGRLNEDEWRSDYVDKASLLIEAESNEAIDDLSHAPILKFKEGFPSHPPGTFNSGEEPAMAPMSQEQLTILLARALPRKILPFISLHFSFKYDVTEPPKKGQSNYGPPGPKVEFKNGKPVVTFFRTNFITQGLPPDKAGRPADPTLNDYTWGFVDPAKLVLFFGRVIGRMTQPDNAAMLDLLGPTAIGLTANRAPVLQKSKTKAGERRRIASIYEHQWDDFVGLYLALPDKAKQQYPVAYQYMQEQIENFVDPNNDKAALKKLEDRSLFHDFSVAKDLRTDEEKVQDEPPNPERSLFNQVLYTLNQGLVHSPFHIRLVCDIEDEERAEMLSKDNDEIAKYVDNYTEERREEEFNKILGTYEDFESEGRKISRRILLAMSKLGDFDEARIHMWLYKFSKTFRQSQPVGQRINEEDYKDLKMLYDISEKEGGRLGTGVIPYEAVTINDPASPKPEYEYVRIPQADYIKKVRKRIDLKNPKAMYEAGAKAFREFKENDRYIGYEDAFGQASLQHLLKYDREMAQDVANVLNILGMTRVSTDAKVLAEAYYRQFLADGKEKSDYISEEAYQVMLKYEEQLLRRQNDTTKEFISAQRAYLLQNATPDNVEERVEQTEARRKTELVVLSEGLKKGQLFDRVEEQIIQLVNEGETNHEVIQRKTMEFIESLRPELKDATDYHKRLTDLALRDGVVVSSIENIAMLSKYKADIEPNYTHDIERIPEAIRGSSAIREQFVPEPVTEERYQEYFVKQGIELTAADQEEIKKAGTEDGVLKDVVDTVAEQNKVRAEKLKLKLIDPKTDDKILMRLGAEQALRGLNDPKDGLEATLAEYRVRNLSYEQAFGDWLGVFKIYNTPPFARIRDTIHGNLRVINSGNSVAREKARHRLDATVAQLYRALTFIDEKTEDAKKEKKD